MRKPNFGSRDGLMPPMPAERLRLQGVTLCAVSSSNLKATVAALRTSMSYIDFAEAILFTHVNPMGAELGLDGIRIEPIGRLASSRAYSRFILECLADYISTDHCLIAQWDGHVIDPTFWRSEFLCYDYIGASWPQFGDGRDVGNGGFSLRSKRLMEACRESDFEMHHPEDLAICRTNRELLENRGMRFAPRNLANAFSAERDSDPSRSFGYHGAFLMPRVLGSNRFWALYEGLDNRRSVWVDFWRIALGVRRLDRITRMFRDRRKDCLP